MGYTLLFGGKSFEHEISIVSAVALLKILGPAVESALFLDDGGTFYAIPLEAMRSNTFSGGLYKKWGEWRIVQGGFEQKSLLGTKRLRPRCIINLVHGAQGEDGVIASLLDFFAIPYVGPRMEGCAVSYNKWMTKLFAEGLGVRTLPFQRLEAADERRCSFDFPVIVKPARLGSSIGVSIAKDTASFEYALDVAFELDSSVIVEPFYEGIEEYNVAGCLGGGWHLSLVEAPQKKQLLDFEQKYLDFSRTQSIREAEISDELKRALHQTFQTIYDPLFRGALIRCDFFVRDDEIFLNEINPIPGSMANYLFSDFKAMLADLAENLPASRSIKVDYRYIRQIQSAKGPKLS